MFLKKLSPNYYQEGIKQYVHSYYIAATDPAVPIDPRVPAEGIN